MGLLMRFKLVNVKSCIWHIVSIEQKVAITNVCCKLKLWSTQAQMRL